MERDLAIIAACGLALFLVCAVRVVFARRGSPLDGTDDEEEDEDELDDPNMAATNRNGRMP